MGQDPRAAGASVGAAETAEPEARRSPEEIRADIAQTREEVGDTVEALAEKTDVKAQAHQRVEDVKSNVRAKAGDVMAKVRGTTPSSAQQGGKQAASKVRENPVPFVLGGAVLVAFLIGRRTGRP